MASDNFVTTTVSHVFTAKVKDKKGLILDWVREDENVTEFMQVDVSGQADGTNREFVLPDQPVQGQNNINPAEFPTQVKITVNGKMEPVLALDGNKVLLASAPASGSLVFAQYFRKIITDPGLYYIEVTKDLGGTGQFEIMIDTLVEVESIIIESASGGETTFQLTQIPVWPGTFELFENDAVLGEGPQSVK